MGGISKENNAGDVHCLLQLLYPSPDSLLPCSHSAESKVAGLGVGGLWLYLSCCGCYEHSFTLSIEHPVGKQRRKYSCLWQDTDHSLWRGAQQARYLALADHIWPRDWTIKSSAFSSLHGQWLMLGAEAQLPLGLFLAKLPDRKHTERTSADSWGYHGEEFCGTWDNI